MRIEVTAEHILLGKRSSYCQCPIAMAAKQAFGEDCGVVGQCLRRIDKGILMVLPLEASQFVMDFDAGKAAQPFSFEV